MTQWILGILSSVLIILLGWIWQTAMKDIEEIKKAVKETRTVLFEIRDVMLAKGIIEP